MITFKTTWIPFGSFKAMCVWPFLFLRKDKVIRYDDINHEKIHGRQQLEMLPLGVLISIGLFLLHIKWWLAILPIFIFYLAYLVSWLIELVRCAIDKSRGDVDDDRYLPRKYISRVEHSIIFEREAYTMEEDECYLNRRGLWAWVHY